MPLRVIENRQLLQILAMFMIVQFFGLLLASMVFSGSTYQQVKSVQVVSSAVGALFYIIYIVIFSVVLIFLFRIYRGNKFFTILEGAVVFISSFFVFLVIFGTISTSTLFNLAGTGITANLVAGIGGALLLVLAKNKWPKLRNATAIIASIGVGLILGISFSFLAAIIFMVILAAYDFIAVFVTKHMITMAKAMSSRNLAFLVGVSEFEALPRSDFSKKELEDYKKEGPDISKNPTLSRLYRNGMLPVVARVELGTGDFAIPLMVAIAAYEVTLNFVLSFFIIFGAIFGLLLTTHILRRYKRALPAIPPLLFGIAIGMSAYAILFSILHV